jgi:hypothetical protein
MKKRTNATQKKGEDFLVFKDTPLRLDLVSGTRKDRFSQRSKKNKLENRIDEGLRDLAGESGLPGLGPRCCSQRPNHEREVIARAFFKLSAGK